MKFQQHFTSSFFVQEFFSQLFLYFQFGFVIFWQKNIDLKVVSKMLMKLRPGADAMKKITPSLGIPYLGV